MAASKRDQCLKGEKKFVSHVKLREPLTVKCVCPKCGYKVEHEAGKPCREISCPTCIVPLEREGAPHDVKVHLKKEGTV